MNKKKLKDIERRSYDPTMPHKDFPPHIIDIDHTDQE